MKKFIFICLLASTGIGCKIIPAKNAQQISIGVSELEFKENNRYARLVYLADDQTSTYEIFQGSGEALTISDFYYFKNGKLSKFEKKTHYFNNNNVRIEAPKDTKN